MQEKGKEKDGLLKRMLDDANAFDVCVVVGDEKVITLLL